MSLINTTPNVFRISMEYDFTHFAAFLESALNIAVDTFGADIFFVEIEAFSKLSAGALLDPQKLQSFLNEMSADDCTVVVNSIEEDFSEIVPSLATHEMLKHTFVKDGFEWYTEHRRRLSNPPAEVNYRSEMMPARNQMGLGSCVAFACTAVFEWFQNKQNDGENQYFSPNFLYRHRCIRNPAVCYKAQGMRYDLAFETMVEIGMIPEDDMPYDLSTPYDSFEEVESRHFEQAKMTRLHTGLSIWPSESYPIGYTDQQKTDHLKTMLAEFGPGIISLGGWDYEEDASSPTGCRIFYPDRWGQGGHATVMAGYDEYGVIIRNSWGDHWCDEGYAHLPWTEIWKRTGDMHFATDRSLEDDAVYGTQYRCAYPKVSDSIQIGNLGASEEEICTNGHGNEWNPSGDNANFPGCKDCNCCHKLDVMEMQGSEMDNYKPCHKDDTLLTMGRAFHHSLGGSECSDACSDNDAKLVICRGTECHSKAITSRQSCQAKVNQLIDEGECHGEGVFFTNLCESEVKTPECGCLRPGQRRVFVQDLDYIAVFQIKERCPFTGECPIWGNSYCPNKNWCGGWSGENHCEGDWGCCGAHGAQSFEVRVPAAGHQSLPCEFRHGATQTCTYNPDDECHSQAQLYPTRAPTRTPDKFGESCANAYDTESDGTRINCQADKRGETCHWCGLHNGRPQVCCPNKNGSPWRYYNNPNCADAVHHEAVPVNHIACAYLPIEPYYRLIQAGDCGEDRITDAMQCLHASKLLKLGYSRYNMESSPRNADKHPVGCFSHTSLNKLYIRTADEGIPCSESLPCICLARNEPVDCITSDWVSSGQCSVSCGMGVMVRSREVVTSPAYGGEECGDLVEEVPCFRGDCPPETTTASTREPTSSSPTSDPTASLPSTSPSASFPTTRPTATSPTKSPTATSPSQYPLSSEPTKSPEPLVPHVECNAPHYGYVWDPMDILGGEAVESWEDCASLCESSISCFGATLKANGECWFSGPMSTLEEIQAGCTDEDDRTHIYCSWYAHFIEDVGCEWFVDSGTGTNQCSHPIGTNCCKATCGLCPPVSDHTEGESIAIECPSQSQGIALFSMSGDCDSNSHCVSSANYPEKHGNNEHCSVTLNADVSVSVGSTFSLETCCDRLLIRDVDVESASAVPASMRAGETFTWTSDFSVQKSGWKLCFQSVQSLEQTSRFEAKSVKEMKVVAFSFLGNKSSIFMITVFAAIGASALMCGAVQLWRKTNYTSVDQEEEI